MVPKVDHFTPLSRAVASIDRDSYAARFAIYDREHKALLRRLATADAPLSDDDIAREEQAFRDAVRRIEFADEDHEPTLVPQDEPVEQAPPEPRRAPVWPQLRAPRRESVDVPSLPALEEEEPGIAVEALAQLSERRSLARRVGERLALALVALAAAGIGLWLVAAPQDAARNSSHSPAESIAPAAPDNGADAKAPPSWLSPEIFYAPPSVPSPAPSAAAPRADVPLPVPRPER
jgi:hypothetical protein